MQEPNVMMSAEAFPRSTMGDLQALGNAVPSPVPELNALLRPAASRAEIHELLPWNLGPSIPSDRILQEFIAAQRLRVAEGVSNNEVIGPCHPCFVPLLGSTCVAETHPMSRIVMDIIQAYSGFSGLPEKVAASYTMYQFMNVSPSNSRNPATIVSLMTLRTKWRLWPQASTFAMMPVWMHPIPIQLRVPHPAWMDRVPW